MKKMKISTERMRDNKGKRLQKIQESLAYFTDLPPSLYVG